MWRARYRTPQKAHRIAWELTHGPIPVDRQINHHCDNPICVRPDHLYLGTQLDNLKDAVRRGRLHVSRRRVLSLLDRLHIYHQPYRRGLYVALAARYGVTKACISIIRRGRFIGSPVQFGERGCGTAIHGDRTPAAWGGLREEQSRSLKH